MRKAFLLVTILLITHLVSNCQTLFTYGGKAVSKQEFLTAFNKNPSPDAEREKALKEYLNLYIDYKLKVQSGYDEKLYQLPAFELESKNFKQQIAENIIKEEVGIKALETEAFERSQKDIHAAQIFIQVAAGADTVKAYQQIQEAYNALLAGANFGELAAKFSSDEATKQAKGDLGFITVFTLQYAFENEIYALPVGRFSKPFHSSFGYHIFKNISERQALGKRKIAQLLIATPPNATDIEKLKYSKLADSIYNRIMHGENFEEAVATFSNDTRTASNGGVLPDVSVGEFDANYESHIFSLKNIGDISKPFATKYGYHIVKLLEIIPVNTNAKDLVAMSTLNQTVEKDARLQLYKKAKLKKWMAITQFKNSNYTPAALWIFIDSSLANKPLKKYQSITDSTILFTFEKQKIYVTNWLQYLRKEGIQNKANYVQALANFTNQSCIDYYTQHLEDYSSKMKIQAKEFDEANLLFAAMDKHVWGKGGADIAVLKNYYTKYAAKYQWAAGVSALVITCKNKDLATVVQQKITTAPNEWRKIVIKYGADVIADSSRYELQQLPIKQTIESKVGFTTAPEKNSNDDTYTFLYITSVHKKAEQRSFDDARGMVINDYQLMLEQQWIDRLKKQYPIKIDTAVLKTVK